MWPDHTDTDVHKPGFLQPGRQDFVYLGVSLSGLHMPLGVPPSRLPVPSTFGVTERNKARVIPNNSEG